jgi:hypothetical protein
VNKAAHILPVLILSYAFGTAWADSGDQDKDLDLIPPSSQAPAGAPTPVASGGPQKIFIEEAFTQSWLQGEIVPVPPPPPVLSWEERALLDLRREWTLADNLRVTYSGQLNFRVADGLDFPSQQNVINDLREAYLSWEPVDRLFFDVGRINLKSGVALGFNPTDYFKTRSVVEPLSADPVMLRDDRLGTLMARVQRVWEGGSFTAAFAPKVASDSPIYTEYDLPSFDPMFDRTNAHNRWLLKSTIDLAKNFSPEFLVYSSQGETRWGTNLTQNLGQSIVAYLEYSGGRQTSLSRAAFDFGRATGTLPPAAADVLPGLAPAGFRNQVAVGASYTTELPKITFNLEFHYNQGGFTGADWNQWFETGTGTGATSPIAGALWYAREYASDQQELMSRRYVFLRADWVDAFIPKLELSGFIDANLIDGSTRTQLGADYYLSDQWTVGGLVLVDSGGRHSEFGSLPQGGSVMLKVVRYL